MLFITLKHSEFPLKNEYIWWISYQIRVRKDTIYWHVNVTQGGPNLHSGENMLPVQIFTRMQIIRINTA